MKAGTDAAIVELKEVSLSFEGLQVFERFNLTLEEGESLVLVGPSGSGKSSLLKLMAGLLTPDSGEVLFRGQSLSTLSKKQQAQHLAEVGMLFQQNALFDSMTVFENLFFVVSEVEGERVARSRSAELKELLAEVGLDHVLDHFPSEISGGMQKRLGIARALCLHPKLVFYDDPTAGLDPITSRKIVSMILSLQSKWGGTIVAVTNDMMRAFQLAGTCMLCLPREFILTGSAEDTLNHSDPRVQQFIQGQVDGPLGAL
jgi:phospholipid/cholesterol/gamma-HCH transport system ATP-binding protein